MPASFWRSPSRLQIFKTKIKILDHLNRAPAELVQRTLAQLEDAILGITLSPKSKEQLRASTRWNDTYMRRGKIPTYWFGEWLFRHYFSVFVWSQDEFDAVDEGDSSNISHIFDYICGITPNTHLPRPMLDKDTCDKVFKARADKLGRATEEWGKNIANVLRARWSRRQLR